MSARAAFDSRRPPAARSPSWRERLGALARVMQRVVGAPDYDGYLAHHARCHPEAPPLTRDEFVRRRQEERYSRPGARCC